MMRKQCENPRKNQSTYFEKKKRLIPTEENQPSVLVDNVFFFVLKFFLEFIESHKK